jgi:Ca2+-binding EF-hand superfamily protein
MSGNNVELKCIFNLFDSNNTGEIDIKQINKINKSIESLAVKKKQGNSPTNFTITQTKLDNDKALPPRPAKKPDQRDVGDNLMNRTQGMSKNVGNRKASYENLGDADKSKPLQTNGKKWGNNSNNMINLNNSKDINDTNSSLDSIDDDMGLPYEREKAETVNTMDLRYFPNKKTTISFNEFCQIFNDSISSKDIQDDILLACFNAFDHDW